MEETYISYELAKLAKNKGFNETCNNSYQKEHGKFVLTYAALIPIGNICAAPAQSFLQKWLREVHKIHIRLFVPRSRYQSIGKWAFEVDNLGTDIIEHFTKESPIFNSYEEALEAGLLTSLNLIK